MRLTYNSRGIRFQIHVMLIIVISVLFCYLIFGNLVKISLSDSQKTQAEMKLEEAKREGSRLAGEVDGIGSDAYVEKAAREYLGLVKPDETIFIINK